MGVVVRECVMELRSVVKVFAFEVVRGLSGVMFWSGV